MDADPVPWLRLLHAPGIGPTRAARLLEACGGDIAQLVSAPRRDLQAAGLSAEAARVVAGEVEPPGLRRDLEWTAGEDRHLLCPGHPAWPARLAGIADPPLLLFVQGDPDLLALPALAIVGSRNPTPAGADNAREFARHLAAAGLVITSGLALGIDGAAHEGALAADGLTVAVAGTGLDRVYPARHADLAHRIAQQGALVSELPLATRPARDTFPRRNRIITGLCVGTLVVEAALRSGSLISARHAMEQGREVFAIPGSIHNPLARGCHWLIRQGAKLVETADDILEELVPQFDAPRGPAAAASRPGPAVNTEPAAGDGTGHDGDPDYARLLAGLDWEPRGVDELAARSGLSVGDVASMLLRLELEGRVRNIPGGLYQRK